MLNSDEKSQKIYLEKIVQIGKELKKDVSIYEKELNKNPKETIKSEKNIKEYQKVSSVKKEEKNPTKPVTKIHHII